MDCSPPGFNTGVGCHFLLQGIFLTEESNPHLLCLQVDSLPLSPQGSSKINYIPIQFVLMKIHLWLFVKKQLLVSLIFSIDSLFHKSILLIYALCWGCSVAHRVWLLVTPWTAAHQVSLSFTVSWSLLKLISIVSSAIRSSYPLSSLSPPEIFYLFIFSAYVGFNFLFFPSLLSWKLRWLIFKSFLFLIYSFDTITFPPSTTFSACPHILISWIFILFEIFLNFFWDFFFDPYVI